MLESPSSINYPENLENFSLLRPKAALQNRFDKRTVQLTD